MKFNDKRSDEEKQISNKRINLAIGVIDALLILYIILHLLGALS